MLDSQLAPPVQVPTADGGHIIYMQSPTFPKACTEKMEEFLNRLAYRCIYLFIYLFIWNPCVARAFTIVDSAQITQKYHHTGCYSLRAGQSHKGDSI